MIISTKRSLLTAINTSGRLAMTISPISVSLHQFLPSKSWFPNVEAIVVIAWGKCSSLRPALTNSRIGSQATGWQSAVQNNGPGCF